MDNASQLIQKSSQQLNQDNNQLFYNKYNNESILQQQSEEQRLAGQQPEHNRIREQSSVKNKKIDNLFQRLKLKVAAKKMVNNTNSRMYQNLQPIQYYLINDKSINLDYKNIINNKNINKQNTLSYKLLKIEDSEKSGFTQRILNFLITMKDRMLIIWIIKFFNKIPVISPSSLFKYIWDFFHMMLILIYLFLIPIHISFGIPFSILISSGIADIAPISFIIDTLINFNTGYYDKGIAVNNKWKILKNYIKNNFLTDILAVIPNIIYHYALNQDTLNYDPNVVPTMSADFTYIIRFFLLFFYMKLNSFNEIIKKLEERSHLSKKISNIIQFIKLLFTIVIIAHIFACLWVFIANIESSQNISTWMDHQEIAQAEWKVKFIRAYYFSVVTMITVGYGDVLPKTDYEMMLSVISIMISCGVYAYLFNEVGSLFNEFSRNKKQMKQNMQLINLYMHKKGINSHMQYQVRDYLEYFWKEQLDRDEQGEINIINQLSDELKQKLLIEANKIILKDSPIFAHNFSDQVIQKTISLIQEQRVLPEEIIVSEGSIDNNSIYFIEKGSVEIILSNQGSQDGIFPVQILKKGQCFESDTFFTGGAHSLTIRSREFTTLLFIKRSEFLQLLKEYPEDYEHFCFIKDQILLNTHYQLIGQFCQSCGSYKHTSQQCQYLHYCPNIMQQIQLYNKINNNDNRQEFKRQYPKKKICTLQCLLDNQDIANEYQDENEESITELIFRINQENQYKYQNIQTQEDIEDVQSENLKQDEGQQQTDLSEKKEYQSSLQEITIGSGQNIQEKKTKNEKSEEQLHQSDPSQSSMSYLLKLQKQYQNSTPQKDESKIYDNIQLEDSEAEEQIKQTTIDNIEEKNNDDKSKNDKSNLFVKQNIKSIQGNTLSVDIVAKIKNKSQQQSAKLRKIMLQKNQQNYGSKFNQQLMDYLQTQFKIVNKNLKFNKDKINSNQLDNQMGNLNFKSLGNEVQIEDSFDVWKNFNIYFPFHNLDYQLQLMQLSPDQKRFFTQRISLDNLQNYKKQQANRNASFNNNSNDTMNKLIKKFQKEKQDEIEQMRHEQEVKTIQTKKQTIKRNQNSILNAEQQHKNSVSLSALKSPRVVVVNQLQISQQDQQLLIAQQSTGIQMRKSKQDPFSQFTSKSLHSYNENVEEKDENQQLHKFVIKNISDYKQNSNFPNE